jgi:ferredoxin
MSSKAFSDLADSVTSRGLCRLCGACALICPVDVIRVSPAKAELVGECISCGLCSAVCPVINGTAVFKPRKIVL